MTLEEFRNRVFAEFGPDLGRATPANITEFLARIEQEEYPETGHRPLDLREDSTSYETIIKKFLARMLLVPPQQSVVPLWTFACQLAFAMVAEFEEGRLPRLPPPEA